MVVNLKTDQEIGLMRQGGKILAGVIDELKTQAVPGITTKELDSLAEKLILDQGGEISFKTVRDYKYATCMCVNEVVVHGLPSDYRMKTGDLLGIDCGVLYGGLHTDMSWTLRVQTQNSNVKTQSDDTIDEFLKIGEETLFKAIKQARIGNRIGHISQIIQDEIGKAGYRVVRNLTGHGVGRVLHEEPMIPGFLKGTIEKTPLIEKGMTLAIEVIYTMGSQELIHDPDGWTIKTKDGSLAVLFEQTIAVLDSGPEILTTDLFGID